MYDPEGFWDEWKEITEGRKSGVHGTLHYIWLMERYRDKFPFKAPFWRGFRSMVRHKTWNYTLDYMANELIELLIIASDEIVRLSASTAKKEVN